MNYQLTVLAYIESHDYLRLMFNHYLNNCKSISNPYHNLEHTFKLMYTIIDIYEHQKDYDDITINDNDLLVLLTAALYHDYDHSGGKYKDAINVHIAKYYFEESFKSLFEYSAQSQLFIDKVLMCIINTQYPYIYSSDDIDNLSLILRECDYISQLIDPNDFFTHVLCGLKTELNSSDWKTALSNYVDFSQSMFAELKLSYSQKKFSVNIEDILSIIKKLTDIIKHGTN